MSMDNNTQPPIKRFKYDSKSDIHTKAILPTEYTLLPTMAKVYISRLKQKQHISQLMQELSQKLPLYNTLHFLKRVRQNELIICLKQEVSEEQTLKDYLHKKLSTTAVEILCEDITEIEVPTGSCKLRWQHDIVSKSWPCKFHPDKYLESLYDGTNFTSTEIQFHKQIAQLLQQISTDLVSNKSCGVCVDPRTGSIVALATSQMDTSLLLHCPMVLIDFVARTQNPSHWVCRFPTTFVTDHIENGQQQEAELTLAGIETKYLNFLKENAEYATIKLGAERVKCKPKLTEPPSSNIGVDNLAKYGPYLCTGYDIYLTNEACLMCAMALVHSRVRRVFFLKRSASNGALCTRFKLHGVKELNHHYEVFQIQCNTS